MLNLHLIVVGKLKENYWRDAEAEYLKRLQPFCNLTIHELKEESFGEKDPVELTKEKEADKIFAALEKFDPGYVIALEERGKTFASPDFARQLQNWHEANHSITLIIGGPLGIAPVIRKRAATTLSLSPLTFTHQMTRVILLEQLYRAMMINSNRRYHY